MSIQQIEPRQLDELILDPRNPRLGLRGAPVDAPQGEILELMKSWSLEELGTSFLESGFWVQEALLCVEGEAYGENALIVVEGNRRLAALKLLDQSFSGNPPSAAWAKIVEGINRPDSLFNEIPTILMPDRASVDIFLGYRHVTGIKEWAPAEKAEYISFLIDERGLSYQEVMRKIGSKTDAVRRNYIAFRVLQQASGEESIDETKILDKFSVLFLSLRSAGVQSFLGVDITAEPQAAQTPVPQNHIENLRDFVKWLFGTADSAPVVQDSRQVERFSKVLQSQDAVQYLRSAARPNLDYAYVIAGGEEAEVIDLVESAAFDIEQALSTMHLYVASERLQTAAKRLILDLRRIEQTFPDLVK